MITAVITARSGSRSVPHKNIRKLGGIPLIGWTLSAISNSTMIQNVIFSSDSEKYYKIAKRFNKEILFHKRNSQLSKDVPTEHVLLDVLKKYDFLFDDNSIIVLIQPTAPFISSSDIDKCIKKLLDHPSFNTCLSVRKVSEHPEWIIRKKSKDVGVSRDLSGKITVRQNLNKRWIPNGGIWAIRKKFLEKKKKIVDYKSILVYEMPKLRSIDIDDDDDFKICESLAKSRIIEIE
ncbi:MAG: acylneuraminate cytidylyltransferase family protein [Patescibacteria group bacterium]|nr:acylneuraminate cytidylyltransferase family protein [Patescibacteria group bacterium]